MTRDVNPAREHYCCGCGRHNPIGTHLEFDRHVDDHRALADRAHHLVRHDDRSGPARGQSLTVTVDAARHMYHELTERYGAHGAPISLARAGVGVSASP